MFVYNIWPSFLTFCVAILFVLFIIQTGDVIVLVRRIDDQWLVGRNGESEGMFPANFLQIKMPLPGEVIKSKVFLLK